MRVEFGALVLVRNDGNGVPLNFAELRGDQWVALSPPTKANNLARSVLALMVARSICAICRISRG